VRPVEEPKLYHPLLRVPKGGEKTPKRATKKNKKKASVIGQSGPTTSEEGRFHWEKRTPKNFSLSIRLKGRKSKLERGGGMEIIHDKK